MRDTRRIEVSFYQLRIAFSFAIEALMYDTRELRWTDEELLTGARLRQGERIPGHTRMLGDRFARWTQDMHLPREVIDSLWEVVFEISHEDYRRIWRPK